ncbi:MAG: hypothetical protein RLO02_02025 [Roseitalea porphyridii]
MSALPVIEEDVAEGAALIMPGRNGASETSPAVPQSRLTKGNRKFAVYPASAGFDIFDDLDPVTDFTVEPNIFFAPRFCVPAMPRLDERQVYLMVLQDRDQRDANTRFMMPYTIEKPGFRIGPDLIRAWSSPFGPTARRSSSGARARRSSTI